MEPWEVKARHLIAQMCAASWRQVNTTKAGRLRRKHHPYSVPALAQTLVECLSTQNEERAKRIFLDMNAGNIGTEYTT